MATMALPSSLEAAQLPSLSPSCSTPESSDDENDENETNPPTSTPPSQPIQIICITNPPHQERMRRFIGVGMLSAVCLSTNPSPSSDPTTTTTSTLPTESHVGDHESQPAPPHPGVLILPFLPDPPTDNNNNDDNEANQLPVIHHAVMAANPNLDTATAILSINDLLPTTTSPTSPTTGAGYILTAKIAGALAASGEYSLADVTKVCSLVAANVRTVAAVQSKTGEEEEEEQVKVMLAQLLGPGAGGLHVHSNEPVLLVDVWGSAYTTAGEVRGLLARVVGRLREGYGVMPVRVYVGGFLGGEGEKGFSVSVLNVVNTELGGPSMTQLLDRGVGMGVEGWRVGVMKEEWEQCGGEVVELGVRNWEAGCGQDLVAEMVQQRDGDGDGGVERRGGEGEEVEAGVLPSEVEQRVESEESVDSEACKVPEKETFEDEDEDDDAILFERKETQPQMSPEGEWSSSEKRTPKPDTVDDAGGGREENPTGTSSERVIHLDVSDMADQYPFWS